MVAVPGSAGVTVRSRDAGVGRRSATRIVVSTLGVVAAFAGVEHGVGEVRQGSAAPPSIVFESWPDTAAFAVLDGEPAMTVVPNLAVTGVLAIVAAIALGAWAVWFARRPHGWAVLIALSGMLLLVGGGLGPPLVGVIAGVAARAIGREGRSAPSPVLNALAATWPWLLGAAVLAYLSLVPGVVLLDHWTGWSDSNVVAALTGVAFASLLLALIAARARDRMAAGRAP